jgi:uncharacterized membrane protein YqjE
MSEPEPSTTGPVSSLRRMADSLLALLETRLQLFAVELQCEKLRMMEWLLLLAVGGAVGFIGLLLAVGALALYAWANWRYAGLVGLAVIFLAAAALLFWQLRARLRRQPVPFSDTLAEFKKDRACLQAKN